MSLVLAILGVLFLAAAVLFSLLAGREALAAQGLIIARLFRLPLFLVAGLCLVLAPLLAERSTLRRWLRGWLPRDSQLLLPGLLVLGLVEVLFVLVKLAEYSLVLVSRERFWDNYLVFGGLPVRLPSEPFTLVDYLGSMFLFTAGVVSLLARAALSSFRPAASPPSPRQERIFWALLGFGFVYLALDEMLMFHEFIGANLRFDDGRIVLGYLGLMGATFIAFRRKLLSRPVAAGCLVVGAMFQAIGAIADRFHFWEEGFTPEEMGEMTASGLYLLAILQYAYHDVRALIEPRARGDSALR